MKHIFSLFLVFISLAFALSCTKETAIKNNGLNGKWKLTELYLGYFNGGTFKWINVSDSNSHTLEFAGDGHYTKQENATNNFQNCSGTYYVAVDSTLEIVTGCSTATQEAKISELTSNELIINQGVIEGTIHYKYEAVK